MKPHIWDHAIGVYNMRGREWDCDCLCVDQLVGSCEDIKCQLPTAGTLLPFVHCFALRKLEQQPHWNRPENTRNGSIYSWDWTSFGQERLGNKVFFEVALHAARTP